jgi:AAA15 family ATPase/GTPase
LKGGFYMNFIKVLHIAYKNIPLYKNGQFELNLMATDKVADTSQVFPIRNSLYSQKLAAIIGINASGKTSSLKLLYLALSIILDNTSLNAVNLYGREFLQNDTELRIIFTYQDNCYELHSLIGKKLDTRSKGIKLFFKEEFLRSKKLLTIKTKKDALRFEDHSGINIVQRTKMPDAALSVLQDDDSIVITVTKNNTTALRQFMSFTNMNMLISPGTTPAEVLHAFDANLDELITEDTSNGLTYTVRFKNQEKALTIHSPLGLNNLISSGTIKGQNMISLIKDILTNGGYLIVDELENHMNKELLRMITDIFKSERINKHGACLLFSTHYTEILDFMDRKDNIYVVRREQALANNIEVLNYAKEVKRNDVKKSEIILSNYIKGTAPLYENIQSLEDYLCSEQD